MSELRFFAPIRTKSDEIKARRWIGYWFIGLFSKRYKLEIEHYRHCGEFNFDENE